MLSVTSNATLQSLSCFVSVEAGQDEEGLASQRGQLGGGLQAALPGQGPGPHQRGHRKEEAQKLGAR